ncbi:MAG: hypothetical protein KZQ99_23095, partial [Candidatus Thiodiazotropha sp. (ex Dulcina madagascariensis)]|nr:hypothetical protein [Candidatus Thiodiazotropha sp. (ex Dulcina madagascariensis)]
RLVANLYRTEDFHLQSFTSLAWRTGCPGNSYTQAASHGSKIRYIARFDNIEAGQMRLHNLLQHTLIDLDWVIATIEADDLRHNRVWIDPSLNDSEKQVIDAQTAKLKLRHKRWNTFWLIVGGFFVVLFFILSTIGQI